MTEVAQLISNVGFPIAMCLLMFWQNSKTVDALNNNTKAIQDLKNYVERSLQ